MRERWERAGGTDLDKLSLEEMQAVEPKIDRSVYLDAYLAPFREWLERETVTLGTVRFIGTTLWSDFDAFARAAIKPTEQLNEYFHTLAKGIDSLNDTLKQLGGEKIVIQKRGFFSRS